MRSPACCAPASAIPPAIKLIRILDLWALGTTTANIIWDNFPIPATGFKSVSPSALTASIENNKARTIATTKVYNGTSCPNTILSATEHNMEESIIPIIENLLLNKWDRCCSLCGDIEGDFDTIKGADSGSRFRLTSNWCNDFEMTMIKDTMESLIMILKDIHMIQPCAPVFQSSISPGAQPLYLENGARMPQPRRAPKSMYETVGSPMIMPCPM